MIAVDSSSLIAYFQGEGGGDVEAVEWVLQQRQCVFPPIILSEILSDPKLPKELHEWICQVPQLPLSKGYWERVGLLRARLIAKGLKAGLADALIAQCCLDHEVPLVTRDNDFRHYKKIAGLQLLPD